MRKLILRKRYMDELNGLKDHRELIKVISGIKGCGKSTLVKQFIISLRSEGVRKEDIIYLDLDPPCTVREHPELCSFLDRNNTGGRMYVFLDNIVRIRNWEQSIEWIRNNLDADLYLTCSNTNRFAPDMMTETYTMKMLPLSFREFVELNPCDISYESMKSRYGDYVRVGSLPAVRTNMEPETVNELLTGILSSILIREVMPWNEIRNFGIMYRVMEYVMENCCSLISPANIARGLNLKNQKAVDSYLAALEETYLIIRIPRYDLRARREMKTNSKYYLTDVGLRSASLGCKDDDAQRMLENVVLMELLRRDYTVMVGSYRGTEIDFVAKRDNDTEYFQVAASLADDITDDEIDLLISVNGRHRTIITADDRKYNDIDGVRIMNFVDFLMND